LQNLTERIELWDRRRDGRAVWLGDLGRLGAALQNENEPGVVPLAFKREGSGGGEIRD